MSLVISNVPDVCKVCGARKSIVYEAGRERGDITEFVCTKCGAVTPIMARSFNGAESFGRSPINYAGYGRGAGSNPTRQRNADGSSNDSFAQKGDGGKFANPVTYVIQTWELVRHSEPNAMIRTMQERIVFEAKKVGLDESETSNAARPIIGEVRRMVNADEGLLADRNSRENFDIRDKVLSPSESARTRALKKWMDSIKDDSLEVEN